MDNNELSSVLASLMSDSRVADTVKQLKASLSETTPRAESSTEATPISTDSERSESFPDLGALAKLLNISEKNSPTSDNEAEKRNRLLAALKPYLRENRREVIDRLMSLSNLTGLIDLFPKNNS